MMRIDTTIYSSRSFFVYKLKSISCVSISGPQPPAYPSPHCPHCPHHYNAGGNNGNEHFSYTFQKANLYAIWYIFISKWVALVPPPPPGRRRQLLIVYVWPRACRTLSLRNIPLPWYNDRTDNLTLTIVYFIPVFFVPISIMWMRARTTSQMSAQLFPPLVMLSVAILSVI